MNLVRWILFIPAAAVAALGVSAGWTYFFPTAYFSPHTAIGAVGAVPLVLGRLLPAFVFVVLASAIVPRHRPWTLAATGLLGALAAWPFLPEYQLTRGAMALYWIEAAGALAGSALGVIVSLKAFANRNRTVPDSGPFEGVMGDS